MGTTRAEAALPAIDDIVMLRRLLFGYTRLDEAAIEGGVRRLATVLDAFTPPVP